MIDKNTGNNNRRTFWYTDAYFACLTTVSGGKNDDLPDPGAWPCCCCVLRTPRSIFWDAYGRSSTRFSTIRHIYAFIKVKAFQPWDHTFSCIHFWTCFMCLSCSLFVREKAPPVWWFMVCGGLLPVLWYFLWRKRQICVKDLCFHRRHLPAQLH